MGDLFVAAVLALGVTWGAAIWLHDTLASKHRNRLWEKKK